MGYRLKEQTTASWLAKRLNLVMYGEDIEINNISSLRDIQRNGLIFAKASTMLSEVSQEVVVIAPEKILRPYYTTLQSPHPRLDFIRALALLNENVGFLFDDLAPMIHPTVHLGENVVIENDVSIDAGCVIGHHVVIRRGTKMGRSCHVQSGAVIGESGFGFERDAQGRPINMLHLGGVKIGNHVHVGANTTICQGTLEPTVIEDDVKIDNLVHIAHNCHIKSRAMIIACAEISGGVIVEEDAWIAPNVSIRQKLTIGAGALVGLGAVVVKNVLEKSTVLGNPAKVKEGTK